MVFSICWQLSMVNSLSELTTPERAVFEEAVQFFRRFDAVVLVTNTAVH